MPKFNAAQRRYNKRVIGLSLLYALLLVAAIMVFKRMHPSGPLAWLLAILPALPIMAIVAAMGRYLVEESDEYLRAMEVRKSLIATGFMLTVTTGWGFLQSFELLPHVDFYWATIIWFGGLGVGGCLQALRR
jgi:Kef-type K+ transport system membrane component KefB